MLANPDANQTSDNRNMQNSDESPFEKKSEGYRAVLKNRDFLSLWLGQVFSQLGDRVTFVIFVAVIASNFYVSTTLESWLYVAFTIPAILLTAIAGVFVDRWNKKYTLITTNILRAFLIVLLPIFGKTLMGIYILAFLVSSVTQFFVPAEASSIPALVKKHHLITANSLFTTTMMGSIIFGFVLGDPLINIFGLKSVHWAISCLFLLSAFCLAFIRHTPNEAEIERRKTLNDFFEELKQGFTYVKNNVIVFRAMLKLAALFSIIVMLSILAISISQKLLYPAKSRLLGAQKFVYIIAFSGMGMVIGSFFVGKFFRNINEYLLIYFGFFLIGLNLLLLTVTGLISEKLHITVPGWGVFGIYLASFELTFRMIFTYIVSGIIGIGGALVAIPVQTLLHSSVPEDMRGKVFGVQFTILSTSSTLPVIIAALGADMIGIINMLIIIGCPIILLGILGLIKNKDSQV